jgi:hypothetical protein
VITVKRGWERGVIGASNLAYLPQYDRFIGIEDGKEELCGDALSTEKPSEVFDPPIRGLV